MEQVQEKLEQIKSNIYGLFFKERDGQISKLDVGTGLDTELMSAVTVGRLSVLQDFDNMCKADAFLGFSPDEWAAVQKFFAVNKKISGWDK